MKKIVTVMLLILIFSSSSFGAVSEDMSVYVRQDVFDAKMEALFLRLHSEIENLGARLEGEIKVLSERIDALDKKVTTRMDALEEKLTAKIDAVDARLSTRIDAVEGQMAILTIAIYWVLGTLGVVFAGLTLAPYLKNLRRPSITLEDVERLIDAKLNAQITMSAK
ncbi:MAG: hypothetical protein IJQ99_10825 [Synergistaceae bacterium]|nr:hypothetical protein [Synergistaceae bacterium]